MSRKPQVPEDTDGWTFEQRANLLKQVGDHAKLVCAPIFLHTRRGRLRNGSMVLLKAGGMLIGLTAGHVADAIIKHVRGEDICQVGAARLYPQTLIERHRHLDLASFALDEQTVRDSRHKAFFTREMPLPIPVPGDEVIFGGYPGSLRAHREGQYDNAFVWVGGRLETVSENNIGMQLNLKESRSVGAERLRSNAALGGISGGPVFRITPDQVDGRFAVKFELVGIVHECTRMKIAPEYTLVRAHTLTALLPDGRFRSSTGE